MNKLFDLVQLAQVQSSQGMKSSPKLMKTRITVFLIVLSEHGIVDKIIRTCSDLSPSLIIRFSTCTLNIIKPCYGEQLINFL